MTDKIIKMEIIIPSVYMKKLVELLQDNGVKGFSGIDISFGAGTVNGERDTYDFIPATESHLLFSVMRYSTYRTISTQIGNFLDNYGGAHIITEVLEATNIYVN